MPSIWTKCSAVRVHEDYETRSGSFERTWLHLSHLDDILLIGNSIEDCKRNVDITYCLLQELGFIINCEKSVLQPSHQCKFLGFYLDTKNMLVKLPEHKQISIQAAIEKLNARHSCKIREFASFLGSLGDCCEAAKYGWVYMKNLEREKMLALRDKNDDYEFYREMFKKI